MCMKYTCVYSLWQGALRKVFPNICLCLESVRRNERNAHCSTSRKAKIQSTEGGKKRKEERGGRMLHKYEYARI